MKFQFLVCLYILSLSAHAQVLRDLNYSYQYDLAAPFTFQWNITNDGTTYTIFYEVNANDSSILDQLTIQLETRESLSEKSGTIFHTPPVSPKAVWARGIANLKPGTDQHLVVAKITLQGKEKNRTYIFHRPLPKTPTPFVMTGQSPVLNSFITNTQEVVLKGFDASRPLFIGYYNDPFPAAAPAFSTTQAKVSKIIKPDSTFTVLPQGEFAIPLYVKNKGLYLIQQDTASSTGLAFRVEEDYPKLGKLESLAGPLIYICTNQEFEKLKQAGSDKKKFDQVILGITGNAERARTFMRNYFKRVEAANVYFSSYKEGWKTDRGMIYIIYGPPEEVYLFDDREIWEYNGQNKVRFQFVKSSTVFDPENYVLIRDKKFKEDWYERIDLWRKARF